MGMTRSNFIKLRPDMSHCFKSRIIGGKPTIVILCAFAVAFLIYEILYFQYQVPGLVNSLTYRVTTKSSSGPNYSFTYHDSLIPTYEKVNAKRQSPATCLFIVRDTDGGFGNRMFLFASAYGLARLHQCDIYIAPFIIKELRAIFVINITNTPVNLITDDSVLKRTDITQRYSACTLFKDLLTIPLMQNLTVYELKGFYQAYGYFIKYKHEINYLYQFNSDVIKKNVPLVEQLVKGR